MTHHRLSSTTLQSTSSRHRRYALLLCCGLMLCFLPPACASANDVLPCQQDPYSDLDYVRELSDQGSILPMQTLLERAMPHIHGRIIETGLEHKGSHLLYEIEYLDDDGKVHEVYFDARSGKRVADETLKRTNAIDDAADKKPRECSNALTAR